MSGSRVATGALLVGLVLAIPTAALAASGLLTRPATVTTVPSFLIPTNGAFACPSNSQPPQQFAVPPPPAATNLTTTLKGAQSQIDFGIVGFPSPAGKLTSVVLHDQPSYHFCQVFISGNTSLALTYTLPIGAVTLTETSNALTRGDYQAIEAPGAALQSVIIDGRSFVLAHSPSGRISQAGFGTATTDVLVQFPTPEPQGVVIALLRKLRPLAS